ncbi:MAG: MBL fold metallo-hydrolase [Tenuifilaceae bacterium]|nr:MBL fold metallo-hydrolase [Tenuifilaceae bacterium]
MTAVETFVFNPFQENTYIVYDETKACIIVDAGCHSTDEQDELVNFIETNGLKPKLAVNTHGHVDHILGSAFVKKRYGINIAGNPEDLPLIQMAPTQALMYGLTIDDVPSIDENLNDDDVVAFGNTKLQVIHTPGHSLGSICLHNEDKGYLLSGDTLFRGSIGRTDLPGGNYDRIIESIKNKLLSLNSDTKVYPGHGEASSIGWEKSNNPFLA